MHGCIFICTSVKVTCANDPRDRRQLKHDDATTGDATTRKAAQMLH
eukprot:SAG31_NODE_3442_length_4265_cov_3.475516_2_plen_46_part_00